ncbi:MAG: hypothetical protein ATN35_00160 [Epulopiscium sp. Nele67-Bin004]|nr:MAG: hypothetical protein ATN35_00160 [Epulopiscium sp. Nele67-Bin004]
MKKFIKFCKLLKDNALAHEAGPRSAQMTYYWILAIFPFLLMLTNMLSYAQIDWQLLLEYIDEIVPDIVASIVQGTIEQMVEGRSTSSIYVGAALSLWSTSAAVNVLIKGIYKAYRVDDKRNPVIKRLVSMVYSLLLAFLIIAMIVLLIFGSQLGSYVLGLILHRYPSYYQIIWDISRFLISLIVLLLGAFCIHRVIPRRHIRSRRLWPAVFFTVIMWHIFSVLFAHYVDYYSNYGAMYGSLGGIFVLIIWLYTQGFIILVGAEFNALIMNKHINRETKSKDKRQWMRILIDNAKNQVAQTPFIEEKQVVSTSVSEEQQEE